MTNTVNSASAPITLSFNSSNQVRVINMQGEPWLVARDVAAALGYAEPHKAVARHCKRAKSLKELDGMIHPIEQNQELDEKTKLIPEPDVYRLIVNSKLPAAETFESWIFDEVLPAIRKTGRYEAPSAPAPVETAPEYLSAGDEQNLSRLAWLASHRMPLPQSVAHAFWYRLRQVTGVASPGKFEVRHLPVMAAEVARIHAVVAAFHEMQYRAAQQITKRILRTGDDADPLLAEIDKEFAAVCSESDAELQKRIAPWVSRDIAALTQPRLALHG